MIRLNLLKLLPLTSVILIGLSSLSSLYAAESGLQPRLHEAAPAPLSRGLSVRVGDAPAADRASGPEGVPAELSPEPGAAEEYNGPGDGPEGAPNLAAEPGAPLAEPWSPISAARLRDFFPIFNGPDLFEDARYPLPRHREASQFLRDYLSNAHRAYLDQPHSSLPFNPPNAEIAEIICERAFAWNAGIEQPRAITAAILEGCERHRMAKDPAAKIQLRKMWETRFDRWAINPGLIARVVLEHALANGDSAIKMRALRRADRAENEDDPPFEIAKPDVLFPTLKPNEAIETPDYRYQLIALENEDDYIVIAPHTLMFMANFIAATRMNTSRRDALDLRGGEQVIGEAVFLDPVVRIKGLTGLMALAPSQARELYRLSQDLKEGSFGITTREADVWFAESLVEAARGENARTLNLTTLRVVYERLVDLGKIDTKDVATRRRYQDLMDKIALGDVIPKLHRDVFSALRDDAKALEIHSAVVSEIITLKEDPGAHEYMTVDGSTIPIEKERLAKVAEIFKRMHGVPLNYSHLAMFYLSLAAVPVHGRVSNDPKLIEAINEYVASRLVSVADIPEILAIAQGGNGPSREARQLYTAIERTMTERLGYNKRSLTEALRLLKESQEQRGRG